MSGVEITYTVGGMSCGHCKSAVEEEVGRVPGVEFVKADLESKLVVVRGDGLEDEALRAAIDEAGYVAAPAREYPAARAADRGDDVRRVRRSGREEAEQARWRDGDRQLRDRTRYGRIRRRHGLAGAAGRGRRVGGLRRFASARRGRRGAEDDTRRTGSGGAWSLSAVLTLPVLALAMIPPLQFDGWGWVSLLLATPVVLWGGWPFHRAALVNARHGAATMDTLISIGTLAAWTWSLVALGLDVGELYFEVASVVTVFILMGRTWRPRAAPGRRAEGAARARREGRAASARDGSRARPDRGAARRRPVRRPAGREDRHRRRRRSRASRRSTTSLLTGESVPVEVGPGVRDRRHRQPHRPARRPCTRVGADTAVAQIGRLVDRGAVGQAPVQRLADRVSAVFVPVVIAIARRHARLLARHRL